MFEIVLGIGFIILLIVKIVERQKEKVIEAQKADEYKKY